MQTESKGSHLHNPSVYNDMTYEGVARTLKVPVSTVKYKTKKEHVVLFLSFSKFLAIYQVIY